MIDNDRLLEPTQSYLKSLVAQVSDAAGADVDATAPFGELGVDSFRVLKIIKALESDFGTLPKTLLFENFNIQDLAHYFVRTHADVLAAKFSPQLRGAASAVPAAARVDAAPARPHTTPATSAVAGQAAYAPRAMEEARPVLLPEKEAFAHPALGECVRDIFARYKNEGSVSRGTRNIAPNLFIGSERRGFINYSRSKNIILAYAYTGPKEYFPVLVQELHAHCVRLGFELNLLAEEELESIGAITVSSTPFGALQRVRNLQQFKLDGSAMRRLRYQVSNFAKSGKCRTEELAREASEDLRRSIASIIDEWCAARTMVNPLIHIVRDEIVAGTLNPEHRLFLTYVDEVLHNVILISPMSAEQNGYLMDLEFYTKSMPLGGLEFAIVKIIDTLVAEGCDVLSLGGTYGCKLQTSANADPQVDRILDDLRMQKIFNDEGNLQFKNKFRPENTTIFLLRPVGECTPDNVIDIIMMIADPMKMQTSDAENHGLTAPAPSAEPGAGGDAPLVIEGEERSGVLAEFGFNPLNIPAAQVEHDLKTDSWAQLEMPAIASRRQWLHSQLPNAASVEKPLRDILPFEHVLLTTSGRTAERVFCKAWPRKGLVPQNLLFPTTLFHQIDNGFQPLEIPAPRVFELDAVERDKGQLDEARLRECIERDAAGMAFVCIELSNNASGGHPVSLQHLKAVKALLAQNSIALVMDATRVLENAQFLVENEAACAGMSVWQAAREMLACADAVVISLAKDFCVGGGLIATNDAQLAQRMQACIRDEACGLDAIDRKLVALSLQGRGYIEVQTRRRKEAVRRIWTALKAQGVPVVGPAGGHCVLIDVKQLPEFSCLRHPVASFLAWLYLGTGIRAGAHNVGMQQGSALNDVVRLAIPVGMAAAQVDQIVSRLTALFADRRNIPELTPVPGASASFGDLHAKYALVAYHRPTGALVAAPARDASTTVATTPMAAPSQPLAAEPGTQAPSARDVAIVGMAGRYPKAKNLDELWQNLLEGRDCVDDIPPERMAQRLRNAFTRTYRGGFLDDVDRFDARFFSIAPKDAEILDPQERLFLEVAYEAIEDAGYYPEILGAADGSRDIGVFVGAVWSAYQMLGVEEKMAGRNVNPSSFFWSIANRVSYWMNLNGPSLTLDTACSASLTAIQLACDAIGRGECSGAIVGGVNLDLHQSKFDINSVGGSLSRDGVCRSFGKGADGYVSGEGVGALFLKPLDQAIADGDHIHGVIRSAVVTHSGRTSGYMIPGPQPQTRLVRRALERAGVDARSIGYIEAHGTGTDLGDSIEIAGLSNAFRTDAVPKQNCSIGCIKTNIGHLEAASGIVGVQKILLQMRHGKLVPSLHSAEPNENIDFPGSPFHVQQEVQDWVPKQVDGVRFPRRAGISAIGAGGTSAHLVIEQFEPAVGPDVPAAAQTTDRIFPLSARTEDQLKQAAARLLAFLRRDSGTRDDDIAHTLQVGRRCFDHRLAVVAATREQLIDKLTGFLDGQRHDDVVHGHVKEAEVITGFLSQREKQDFVGLIVQSRDPRRLARLWSQGVIASWMGLDIGQTGRKTPLPTYPFADERYWITRRAPALLAGELAEVNGSEASTSADAAPSPERSPAELPVPAAGRPAVTYHFSIDDGDAVPPGRSSLGPQDKARLFVRQLLANELHVSADELRDDSQIMDTGITSMDMAEMTRVIKDRIDPGFSPIAFFECTTVGAFAARLSQTCAATFERMRVTTSTATTEEGGQPDATRMAAAAASAAREPGPELLHLQDARSELSVPDLKSLVTDDAPPMRTVLLTGATGFLGIHVLAELLASDALAQAYCLVRADSREHALERILDQARRFELELDVQRVHAMCGDIGRPGLGLCEEDWQRCSRDAQQIVHASAHVNHIEGYVTFRESTNAMKEVIRLAGTGRRKLVQFISSTAGCALKIGEEFSIFEKEDFIEDGAHVYGGYGQSKWVQETFLKRAHEHGLPYVIHRFGELSGSSRTGRGQTDDMLHRLLQMRLAVGCREKISNDVLDMLPVDFAARLIVGTGRTPDLWNRIVHATHLKPYSFANLYRRAHAFGLSFDAVTRAQYLARCHDFVRYIYAIHPVNGFVLECVLRDAEGSIRHRKMMDGYFSVIFPFEQDNFRRALGRLGLSLPDWNTLFERYFEAWSREDCGFMARIHDYRRRVPPDEAAAAETSAAVPAAGVQAPAVERRRNKGMKNTRDALMLEDVNEG